MARRGSERRSLQQQPLATTGPCQVVGDCIRTSGYPTPGYQVNEVCVISGVPPTPIVVNAFNVEAHECQYDYLMIDGARFCGTSGPQGVRVSGGMMTWVSDNEYPDAGWELCWPAAPPRSPPAPPSSPAPPRALPPSCLSRA